MSFGLVKRNCGAWHWDRLTNKLTKGSVSHPTPSRALMLTQHHTPVCLSLTAYDLPLWSIVETNATIYQKEPDRFHLLLTEPLIQDFQAIAPSEAVIPANAPVLTEVQTPRLLWLEISPYRVIMTMQGNGKFSYRHFWERGVYGLSRYWLQSANPAENHQIRLRNFTRSLFLKGKKLPRHLRVEYELWSNQLQIGHYVMNVEIQL